MHPVFRWGIAIAAVGAAIAWTLSGPDPLDDATIAAMAGTSADLETGERVFWAAGCASCHIAPGAEETDQPVLVGGQSFPTQFGTFYAPNISSDPIAGIGRWDVAEFANAVMAGVTPEGSHYYPAFPYNAYNKADPEDIAALFAYMKTLPADATVSKPHDVGFPFNIRRSLGGWKFLFESDGYVVDGTTSERGRYLAEALAHCGECHTPRNPLGGLDTANWLKGGPNPSGKGKIPGITPAQLEWTEDEIFYYLTTGFTPEYDSAGGHMAAVVTNMARLPEEDVREIVRYLKSLPE